MAAAALDDRGALAEWPRRCPERLDCKATRGDPRSTSKGMDLLCLRHPVPEGEASSLSFELFLASGGR